VIPSRLGLDQSVVPNPPHMMPRSFHVADLDTLQGGICDCKEAVLMTFVSDGRFADSSDRRNSLHTVCWGDGRTPGRSGIVGGGRRRPVWGGSFGSGAAAGAVGVGAGVRLQEQDIPGLAGAAGAVGWAGSLPGTARRRALGFWQAASDPRRSTGFRPQVWRGRRVRDRMGLRPAVRMAPTETYGMTLLIGVFSRSHFLPLGPSWCGRVDALETRTPYLDDVWTDRRPALLSRLPS